MLTDDQRRKAISKRVDYWVERLNVPTPRLRVQRMTRKWGSCSTSGYITLASDLADQEPGFQDFVIAHELLHLRVPNHGKLFKALLAAHVPDWRKYDIGKQEIVSVSNSDLSYGGVVIDGPSSSLPTTSSVR